MQEMDEDATMQVVFQSLNRNNVQMVHAEHPNNEIHFTPDMKNKWKITVTRIED